MLPSIRIISDGKVGDEVQCVGLAEELGVIPKICTVSPGKPYVWFMPWGPIDPADSKKEEQNPLSRPFPDIAIASGRKTVPYLRKIKSESKGTTFTVYLKDPKTSSKVADLIWVPEHDSLRGKNVIVTTTTPNRISTEKLKFARMNPNIDIEQLSEPRILILVGGNSKHHQFSADDINQFLQHLENLANQNVSLMITTSRRTPIELKSKLIELAKKGNHIIWTGHGLNPIIQYFANADQIVVTSDSTNMVGEAAATGKPVQVFEPSGGHKKITSFLSNLKNNGVICNFEGQLVSLNYEPLNSTPVIAKAIMEAYSKHIKNIRK